MRSWHLNKDCFRFCPNVPVDCVWSRTCQFLARRWIYLSIHLFDKTLCVGTLRVSHNGVIMSPWPTQNNETEMSYTSVCIDLVELRDDDADWVHLLFFY